MKSLKFSVTSWNFRFSRGFHETTEIPSYFMKSLKISTKLFTILLTWTCNGKQFCVLLAQSTKRAAEVSCFPAGRHFPTSKCSSDNGSEFTSQVITELKDVWLDLKLVHGKPRHPQSQSSVERASGDIKDMLVAWLADNNTSDWTIGIKFIQFSEKFCSPCRNKLHPMFSHTQLWSKIWHYFLFVTHRSDSHAAKWRRSLRNC